MSTTVTPGSYAVQKALGLLAAATYTALGYSGVVAQRVRETQAGHYALLGEPIEVVEIIGFSDSDGFATRVSFPVTFYHDAKRGYAQRAAEKFVSLVSEGVTVTGFTTHLHHEIRLFPASEKQADGKVIYGVIVEPVLTIEPV